MYILYWDRGGANMTAHALLEEIGQPYELRLIDLDKGDQRQAEYLKLNPHARVPTLIYDRGKVMYESAAITLFLTDRHPEIGMAPSPLDSKRGLFLQWMAYLTNTMQEALMHFHHPEFYVGIDIQAGLVSSAQTRILKILAYLEGELEKNGPFLCGDKIQACDYFLSMLSRWTRSMPKNALHFPHVKKLILAVHDRPAYRRMMDQEGISNWP